MKDIDLEAVRSAMYAHPGVKAVGDDVRLFRTEDGSLGVAATILVTSPDVDPGPVVRTLEIVLEDRFDISIVQLDFDGLHQSKRTLPPGMRGPLKKL